MKNAPTKNFSESALDKRHYTPGQLPKRTDTVLAEVLTCLLESQELTGMDSVFGQNTTRLAAVIHALGKEYGWQIDRRDIDVSTNDGRVVTIVSYHLPDEAAGTLAGPTPDWIEQVKAARSKLRKRGAEKAKADAAKKRGPRNKKRVHDLRQMALWE
jgi:hypothetical protein